MKKLFLTFLVITIAIFAPLNGAKAGTLYVIAVNADDNYSQTIADGGGTTTITGTTTLRQGVTNIAFPVISWLSFYNIDTSSIPATDVISAATLYIYFDSYTATKGVTKTFYYQMLKADESSFTQIWTGTYVSAGYSSHALTASEILEIDVGAGQKTMFRGGTNAPGTAQIRQFNTRAREYVTEGNYSAYLDITHAPPSTGRDRFFIISLMKFKIEEIENYV